MKIKLICVGKTNFNFIDEGILLYSNRLKHFIDFEIIFLNDIKNTRNMPFEELKSKEGQMIGKYFGQGDFVCLLDEKGKFYDSVGFAGFIEQKISLNFKNMIFIIGGAYGFSDEIRKKAQIEISFSKMTFSHQIIRLFFVEQLYRAFTIIKGLPYHNQ